MARPENKKASAPGGSKSVSGEATAPAKTAAKDAVGRPREFGGPKGPEPTRYGDWERKGIVSDF